MVKAEKLFKLTKLYYKYASDVRPFYDQTFSDNYGEWRVTDIWDYALENLDLNDFNVKSLATIAFEPSPNEDVEDQPGSPFFVERANKSDLSYPILVVRYSDGDFIADGNHRLWKARALGMGTIKGYMLTEDELHKIPKVQP